MKKRWILACLVMIVLLLLLNNAAAITEMEYIKKYQEINGAVWDNRQNAYEINTGMAYKTSVEWRDRRYFKFVPEKSGIYTLTLTENLNYTGGGQG